MLGYKTFLTIVVGVASTTYVTIAVLAGGAFMYPAVNTVPLKPSFPVMQSGFSHLQDSIHKESHVQKRMQNKAEKVIRRAKEYRKYPCDPYQRLLTVASINVLSKEKLRSPNVQIPVWGEAGREVLARTVNKMFEEGLLSIREFPAHAKIWLKKTVMQHKLQPRTAYQERCNA